MEALKNPRLIQAARNEAQKIIVEDSDLLKHPALRARVNDSAKGIHSE